MNASRVALTPLQLGDRMVEAQLWLNQLDENDATYGAKRMVAESRLSNLQEAWRDLASWENDHREREEDLRSAQEMNQFLPVAEEQQHPQSSHETVRLPTSFAQYAGSSANSFGGHFASDGVMAEQGRPARAVAWNHGSENTTGPGTPNDSNSTKRPSSASASSVESAVLPPRKRRRGSLSLDAEPSDHTRNAPRPTPSPSVSGANTPSSYESSGRTGGIPEEFYGLFGGDPNEAAQEFRDCEREQKEHMEILEAKRKQELADEDFARSLQKEMNGPSLPVTLPRAGLSNSISNQTFLTPQGQVHRPGPSSPSPPPLIVSDPFAGASSSFKPLSSYRPSNFNDIKQDNLYNALSSGAPVKNEHSYHPNPTHDYTRELDAFVNLDSDDELDNTNLMAVPQPSNDLFGSAPYSWLQGNIQDLPNAYSTGPSTSGGSYGNSQGIGGWGDVANTAQGFATSSFNAVRETMSTLSNNMNFMGGPSYGGDPTDSYAGIPIIDLENEESSFPNFYEQSMARAGFNPMDKGLADRYRERYDYIAHDPTRTAREMKELLENIRPDEDLPPENREGTPAAMVYNLMEHQKLGVAWMRRMEEGTNHGGILADDMGLGKTIQALALMVSRRSSNPTRKTTLIVAPVALLKQWEREIEKKLKPGRQHSLSTFIYHGSKNRPAWEKLRTFDVVLTTFGVVATELKRQESIEKAKRVNANWVPSGSKDLLSLLGDQCHWYRVIIDEAQCIKNKSTKAAIGCCMLKAQSRFCMTGTPMMNNVGELFSLIQFLRIRPYCEWEKFRRDIELPLKGQSVSSRTKAMRQFQALLKSLLLRRTKKSEIDGKPILDLPPRTTTIQHSVFSEDEQSFYKALETSSRLQFNKYLRAGTVGVNYSNILVLLLRLRQACCHPHLLKDLAQESGPSDISAQEMIKLAKELAPEVVNRIKEQATSNDSAQLDCPICMDMAVNPTIFLPCGHDTCSECFARISDPSQAIQDGDTADGPRDVKCPNCRGKITPSRVIDLNAFKKVHMPELYQENEYEDDSQAEVETTDDSDSDDSSDSDEEIDNEGNLRNFVVKDDDDVNELTEDEEANDDEIKRETKSRKSVEESKKSSTCKGKGKAKAKEKKGPKKTLAQLKKEAGIGSKARAKYLRKLAKDWETSTKIEKVMEILRDVRTHKDEETGQTEKTIIFSQFTSLLDLLEFPINREGWKYRRYDGSMSPKARNEAVLDFTDKPDIKVMLVSLKAGNSGLNLVAASQVIIFDPFWNPYIEEQAIDRAHRIGQLKPVQVHRILVENTVEDRIIALQEKKRTLIESALDEKASNSIGRLGTRELAFLFDVTA